MKRSELVGKVNVPKLARELGLSETDIKLAITHTPPTFDLGSIERIKTISEAKRRFNKTKSPDKRGRIFLKAIALSRTLDDLHFVKTHLELENVSSGSCLESKYSLRTRTIVCEMLRQANDFHTVHDIWIKLDSENLAREDDIAVDMMTILIPRTDTVTVLKLLEGDIGFEIYSDTERVQYSLAVIACEHASPEQAIAALWRIREYGFDGEQDCLPVRLLIQKAAQLFPK